MSSYVNDKEEILLSLRKMEGQGSLNPDFFTI